jgi:hypothetical protein
MDRISKPVFDGASPGPVGPSPACLEAHLKTLYALSQYSPHVFASPLGPFYIGNRHAYVPRFMFFGPRASDESWRLSFLAGFDHRDLRASQALLALAGRLAEDAEAGHGLNLSFFPLVDAAGLFLGEPDRSLASANWSRPGLPEIELLELDARRRAYHGFVRVETAGAGSREIDVCVRGAEPNADFPDMDLITSDETDGLPVQFAYEAGHGFGDGPLSAAEDLPFSPFELTIRVPSEWTGEAYRHAVTTLLARFLKRYRAFQAYGQNL